VKSLGIQTLHRYLLCRDYGARNAESRGVDNSVKNNTSVFKIVNHHPELLVEAERAAIIDAI
jgi:predicted kinase